MDRNEEDQKDLIEQIYEAAFMSERWPILLQTIANHVGAMGGTLGRHAHGDPRMIHTEGIADLIAGWIAGGYHLQNERIAPLQRIVYPGFFSDHDVHTPEVRAAMPCYRDYLIPMKADMGAGTSITGMNHEKLVITFEGFPDADTMRASIPFLDALRPHLARAVSLASELQLRECRSAVAALERVGAGAAFLSERGQVIAANDAFIAQLGITMFDLRDRLHLAQRSSDAALGAALARVMTTGLGTSIGIRDDLGIGIAALHLIPLQRMAREIFVSNAIIALVSRPTQKGAPDADLIQTLFDLTPAEAAVARAITNGESVETVARDTGKSVETVRSHLKRVFSKTATGRQNELSNLLRGFAPPAIL